MYNSNLVDESFMLLERAEDVIGDYNDGVAIYRFKGNLYFLAGAFENGRESYEKALAIFDDYHAPNAFYEASTHALTYVFWSQAEAGQGQCEQAASLLDKAKEYIGTLKVEGYPSLIELQIEQTQQYLDVCE
jgi:tetratricopeptide (TPR) repeat protein